MSGPADREDVSGEPGGDGGSVVSGDGGGDGNGGREGERAALVLPRTAAASAGRSYGAAVLVLHGGRADALEPPTVWNLPGARMRPVARAVARACAGGTGHGQGGNGKGNGSAPGGGGPGGDVLLGTVRYRHRGWNGEREDAAHDARRALAELTGHLGRSPVPVVLVGHSMGGRAALRVAGHPWVTAVVGLAPWCPPEEPVEQLRGRRVVLLHGDRDQVTDPRGSRELALRARESGTEAAWLPVVGGDHAMLRRAAVWHALTASVVAGLLGAGPLPAEVGEAFARRGSAAGGR